MPRPAHSASNALSTKNSAIDIPTLVQMPRILVALRRTSIWSVRVQGLAPSAMMSLRSFFALSVLMVSFFSDDDLVPSLIYLRLR
jgi:hypothetical protein